MERRIRFGVLGTANIALKRFIPAAVKTENAVVHGIASRDAGKARDAAERLSISHVYDSYDALLSDPDIDAVYIPLPNALHVEWTVRAAQAGKPVLCEKPLAVSSAEARTMIGVCAEEGVPLMEGFMYRFHPQHAYARDVIDAGEIGDVRFVRSSFTFMLEPFNPSNVRLQQYLAGGALMDVGCYCVNASRMLFAEEPQWASAQWDFRDAFGVEVSIAGILGFSDGRTAIFDAGFRAAGRGSYTVAGTKGSIEVPNAFVPDFGEQTVVVTTPNGTHVQRIAAVDQFTLEIEAFSRALLDARPVPLRPSGAVGTLRAIEALHASAQSNGLRVPLAG